MFSMENSLFLTESVKIKNPPRRRVEGAESEDASLTRCFLTEGTNHRYGNELIVVGIDQISAAGSCRFPPAADGPDDLTHPPVRPV